MAALGGMISRRDEMGKALVGASGRNELNEMRRQLRMGADVDYVDMKMIGGVDMSFTPLTVMSIYFRPCASGHSAD